MLVPSANILHTWPPPSPTPSHLPLTHSGLRLDELGPALTGIVTAARARDFAQLPEAQRRAAVLSQYAQYFGCDEAIEGVTWWTSKDWISEEWSRGW